MSIAKQLDFERPTGSGADVPWVLQDNASDFDEHKDMVNKFYGGQGEEIEGLDGSNVKFAEIIKAMYDLDLVFTEV